MSAELNAMAHKLAYGAARSDIECYCLATSIDPDRRWWDTGKFSNPEDREHIVTAVNYLDARGLIEYHPEHALWVRVLDADPAIPPVHADLFAEAESRN